MWEVGIKHLGQLQPPPGSQLEAMRGFRLLSATGALTTAKSLFLTSDFCLQGSPILSQSHIF